MSPELELIHLQFSHYNEKARWAFDFKGVPYRSTSFEVLGPHAEFVRPLTGSTQMPVIRIGDEVIPGSAAIIDELERRFPAPALYPADPAQRERALQLQRHYDEVVGPAIRLLFVADILEDRDYAAQYFLGELAHAITLDDARVKAAEQTTDAAFDSVAAEASPYLVGDAFTVADLAAASLLSIALYPPEFPFTVPLREQEPMRTWLSRYAAHEGARWVQQMFRRHRGGS